MGGGDITLLIRLHLLYKSHFHLTALPLKLLPDGILCKNVLVPHLNIGFFLNVSVFQFDIFSFVIVLFVFIFYLFILYIFY